MNNEMNDGINNVDITNYKNINTIIKDLSISPQKKLYIYLDSKLHEMINEKNNNYKYYLYDIKDMFLVNNNIKDNNNKNTHKINKDYIPQQLRLNKELKNIFTDDFKTIQLIYDTTPKTFTRDGKNITYFTYEYNFM